MRNLTRTLTRSEYRLARWLYRDSARRQKDTRFDGVWFRFNRTREKLADWHGWPWYKADWAALVAAYSVEPPNS